MTLRRVLLTWLHPHVMACSVRMLRCVIRKGGGRGSKKRREKEKVRDTTHGAAPAPPGWRGGWRALRMVKRQRFHGSCTASAVQSSRQPVAVGLSWVVRGGGGESCRDGGRAPRRR